MNNYSQGADCTISPTARISANVEIGNRVRVGEGAIIYEKVTVGDDCFIGPYTVIGEPVRAFYKSPAEYRPEPTRIGSRSILRPFTCVYSGVSIGEDFESGSHTNIREQSLIGKNTKIGTGSDIQGYCSIGDNCRFHSGVHVTQYSKIGNSVWLMPQVLMLNDPAAPSGPALELRGPAIDDYCVVMARALLMPGIRLGKHVIIAANSRVTSDFGNWDFASGDPAKRKCDSRKFFQIREGEVVRPYPWMKHFGLAEEEF